MRIFFHIISQTASFSGKKVAELEMCILIFSTNSSKTFLILSSSERDMIKMYIGLHLKYTLFLSDFNET